MNHLEDNATYNSLYREDKDKEKEEEILLPIRANFPKVDKSVLEVFEKYKCPISKRSCTYSYVWNGKSLATTWSETFRSSYQQGKGWGNHSISSPVAEHFLLFQLGHFLVAEDWQRDLPEFGMPLYLQYKCTGGMSVKDQQMMRKGMMDKSDQDVKRFQAFLLGYEFCLMADVNIPVGWWIQNINKEKFFTEWGVQQPILKDLGFELEKVSEEIKAIIEDPSESKDRKKKSDKKISTLSLTNYDDDDDMYSHYSAQYSSSYTSYKAPRSKRKVAPAIIRATKPCVEKPVEEKSYWIPGSYQSPSTSTVSSNPLVATSSTIRDSVDRSTEDETKEYLKRWDITHGKGSNTEKKTPEGDVFSDFREYRATQSDTNKKYELTGRLSSDPLNDVKQVTPRADLYPNGIPRETEVSRPPPLPRGSWLNIKR